MNRSHRSAPKKENSTHLVHRVTHDSGISEEQYSDGSKRFTGNGGGVLWMNADGSASLHPPEKPSSQRIRLLLEVISRRGDKPIEIHDLDQFKGEAQLMLEALRQGQAQFFRDLGNALLPPPSVTRTSTEKNARRQDRDAEIYGFILSAAVETGGLPHFEAIFAHYRAMKDYRGQSRAELKGKLNSRGFGWLHYV